MSRSSEVKSKFVSSTIIAPPSTPTYQALSTARAGVARAVEASAATMASFRIDIPFQMRSVTELLEHLMRGPVAVQDYNSPVRSRKAAVLLQPAFMRPFRLIDQAVRTESGQN